MLSTFSRRATLALSTVALATLAACSSPHHASQPYGGYQPAPPAYSNAPVGVEFGRVQQIDLLQGGNQGSQIGAGAVIGAVVGGVLGNQVGGGTGRTLATAAGVVGGAMVGDEIENRNRGQQAQGYRVTIALDRGGMRAYDVPHPGDLRVGDYVQVTGNGQISRR